MARTSDNVVGARLDPEGKERLNLIVARYGMNLKEALGRLLQWFVTQPERVQAACLGQLPRDEDIDVSELIFAAIVMARRSGDVPPADVAAFAAAIREVILSAPDPAPAKRSRKTGAG